MLSPEGFYQRENVKVEDELAIVVQTDRGQETVAPRDFANRYGWKNDQDRALLDGP